LGIRTKLTLLVAGLLVPLIGLSGLLAVALVEDLLVEEMRQRGLSLLSSLAVPCSVSLASHEIERLDDFLAQFRADENAADSPFGNDSPTARDPIRDLLYLCVVDPSGRVMAHTRETAYGEMRADPFSRKALASAQPIFERLQTADGTDSLAVAVPVQSGLRWGTLIAELSLDRLHARTARMRWQVLTITLILIALTVLALTIGLRQLVVRPVQDLSRAAERLGSGELEQRVAVRSQRDELGTLARVFNATAKQLYEYTHELESKVQERSQEVYQKNAELTQTNQRLTEAYKRLEEVATTDGLTGLANKSHLLSRLDFEVLRAHRGGHQLSLMMMDVDHFKHYNDTHGHLPGDRLLAQLAELLRANLRSIDIIGRFGGEEFCVVLLDTGKRAAYRAAEKIRRAIERHRFEGDEQQPGGTLTISIGVAELEADPQTGPDRLIERADQALYKSKAGGRNRVEVA
jgi:diguanylate cyclase (GGDEF)-like protein